MRGIERLVAGALLVMAVTGTAVLARTSGPGGGPAQALRLQSPPRSNLVAPLPVVVAAPTAPPHQVATRRAKPPAPAVEAFVALGKPVEVAAVAPSAPASQPTTAPPTPAQTPPAAPAPAPTPAPSPAPTTRVVAAAQPPAPTTITKTKTFGHSHPRGHAWGHVKHAVTTLSTDDPQGNETDDAAAAEAQQPAPDPPPAAPTAAPPAPPAPDPGNGNGNGHAYGHSKHGDGD